MKNTSDRMGYSVRDNHDSLSKKNKEIVINGSNYGSVSNKHEPIKIKGDNGKGASVKNINGEIFIGGANYSSVNNMNDSITIQENNYDSGTVENLNDDIEIGEVNYGKVYNGNGDITVGKNIGEIYNQNGDIHITSMDLYLSVEGGSSNQNIIYKTKRSLFGNITQIVSESTSGKIFHIKSPDLTVSIDVQSGIVKQRDHEVTGEKFGTTNIIEYHLSGGFVLYHVNDSRRMLFPEGSQLLTIEDDFYSLKYTPSN